MKKTQIAFLDRDGVINSSRPNNGYVGSLKHFKCDITNPNDYNELLTYVTQNGKFDFCICTHTLEDIMNPIFVCEQIEKISNEGYIAFPSKYRELSRIYRKT